MHRTALLVYSYSTYVVPYTVLRVLLLLLTTVVVAYSTTTTRIIEETYYYTSIRIIPRYEYELVRTYFLLVYYYYPTTYYSDFYYPSSSSSSCVLAGADNLEKQTGAKEGGVCLCESTFELKKGTHSSKSDPLPGGACGSCDEGHVPDVTTIWEV